MNQMHFKSIVLYMTSSFLIIVFNKQILTTYQFPSVAPIMFLQSLLSSIVFATQNPQKPSFDIVPVCIINVANVFFGLNAAGTLNVAMFSALRRISVFMTMLAQWLVFSQTPSKKTAFSIVMMVLGAFIAAADDLTFDFGGYTYVTLNNILTVSSQIATKNTLKNGWSKKSILFWTSMCSVLVGGLIVTMTFRPHDFEHWHETGFWFALTGSLLMGLIINWASAWVIEKNDALTLSVAGSTKSAVLGLLVCFGWFDNSYQYSLMNFMGLQLSTIASLWYVYCKHLDTK